MSLATIDHLSHSQVQTFTMCPRRWHYEKVMRVPAERTAVALAFGSALHEALAEINEAALLGTTPDPRSTFLRRWRAALDAQVAPLHFGKDDSDDLLTKGLNLLAAYQPPPGIVGVEEAIEVQLDPELPPIHGRIDLIRRGEEGDLILVDLKTSASKSIAEPSAVEAQLALYQEAYPAARHEVILLTKQVKTSISTVAVTPWPRARLVQHYREVFVAMRAGIRYAVRGWHCSSCAFRDRCQSEG
jgi:putative RecB family exonuclease